MLRGLILNDSYFFHHSLLKCLLLIFNWYCKLTMDDVSSEICVLMNMNLNKIRTLNGKFQKKHAQSLHTSIHRVVCESNIVLCVLVIIKSK